MKRFFACGVAVILGITHFTWAADGVPAGVENVEKTHKQTTTLDPQSAGEAMRLADFCIAPDGSVVTLVARGGGQWGAVTIPNQKGGPAAQVRVLDAQGEKVRAWDSAFGSRWRRGSGHSHHGWLS